MTTEEMRTWLQGQMEDEIVPAAVLAWVARYAGKPLRVTMLPELPVVLVKCEVAGMMHIESPEYRSSKGREGLSFLVYYSGRNRTIPTAAEFAERNACYYRGRQERNAERRAVLASDAPVGALAHAVSRVQDAVAEYRAAVAALQGLDFDADRWALERLAGVISERKG